ncbi:MAG: hypothetical protein AAGA30_07545, partial [Planctomycetota bacterium]
MRFARLDQRMRYLHRPELKQVGNLWVGNCGDWTSNESFIVETMDGELVLGNFKKVMAKINS